MGPRQSIKTCLRKSVTFSGWASRSEFWWFAPIWQLGIVVFYTSLIPAPETKNQIFGSLFLLVVLSLPALSAAARRSVDAGFDISWVGWGFGLIFFGNGLIDIENSPANFANQIWFTPVGLSIGAIGALILVFILTRPSKISVNPHEVSP